MQQHQTLQRQVSKTKSWAPKQPAILILVTHLLLCKEFLVFSDILSTLVL